MLVKMEISIMQNLK